MRVLSTELKNHVGETVSCEGWVHSVRELGKVSFVLLRDRRGKLQATFKGEVSRKVKEIGLEDVVRFTGLVKEDDRVKGGAELEVKEVEVLNPAEKPLPVDIAGKTETSLDTRLDHRVLDLRGERQQAIFRIETTICDAYREFLLREDFTEIRTPKIIATGTEGGANLFPVVYFDKEAFLAQSPQFYKQMLVGAGFERVFEIAPVYRAEEHDTPFHLNEYISMDFEMGFIKNEEDCMRLCSELVVHMLNRVKSENEKELEIFKAEINVPKTPFPVIHYWEIPEVFKEFGKDFDVQGDLNREDELLLGKYALEKFGSDFIFVDNYPSVKRPAYTMIYEKDERFTRGYDLLYKGTEIVTGGQRIHKIDLLKKRFKEKGYPLEPFEFYFEVFRFGMPPHGGQAFGLERITTQLLGLGNVREAAFFPRDKKRIYP